MRWRFAILLSLLSTGAIGSGYGWYVKSFDWDRFLGRVRRNLGPVP